MRWRCGYNEVPGISVPSRCLSVARRRSDAPSVGLAWRRLASLRDRVAGVYLIPPFKQPEAVLELLR
jgi:hypothetical protein